MKKVKMLLYGAPGTGKSVFAHFAPNRFFITTDGNYEWLEDFGAKEKDHKQIGSFAEIETLLKNGTLDNYDTIIVDLLEDTFKWCEQEYCVRNKLSHVSDQGYGKGYDCSRNEYFLTICKLLGLDKNIILLSHEQPSTVKDRRGVEHQIYGPSNRIPDKVLDMIEGRLRYCIRCYTKDEVHDDGTIEIQRLLSVIPKPNEWGIARGLDPNTTPHDIPLDWNEFCKVIGVDNKPSEKIVYKKPEVIEKPVEKIVEEQKIEQPKVEETANVVEDIPFDVENKDEENKPRRHRRTKAEIEAAKQQENPPLDEVVSEEQPKVEEQKPVEQPKVEEQSTSQSDKIAAIKAKLAAMKNK